MGRLVLPDKLPNRHECRRCPSQVIALPPGSVNLRFGEAEARKRDKLLYPDEPPKGAEAETLDKREKMAKSAGEAAAKFFELAKGHFGEGKTLRERFLPLSKVYVRTAWQHRNDAQRYNPPPNATWNLIHCI